MFFEIFRNLWKFSENFGNGSKLFFRCFFMYNFLKFLGNLGKCSEIVRKIPDMIVNVCNGSQGLKRCGAGF